MPGPAADAPLYDIKANLFKALAHPARIRVLEILLAADAPVPVSTLLAETELEASLLSQHLGVLRRHHVVTSTRTGNTVTCELAYPQVATLLGSAREFLLAHLDAQHERLALAVESGGAR